MIAYAMNFEIFLPLLLLSQISRDPGATFRVYQGVSIMVFDISHRNRFFLIYYVQSIK